MVARAVTGGWEAVGRGGGGGLAVTTAVGVPLGADGCGWDRTNRHSKGDGCPSVPFVPLWTPPPPLRPCAPAPPLPHPRPGWMGLIAVPLPCPCPCAVFSTPSEVCSRVSCAHCLCIALSRAPASSSFRRRCRQTKGCRALPPEPPVRTVRRCQRLHQSEDPRLRTESIFHAPQP